MTMVAGKIVFENGRLLSVDEEAIKAEARELMKSYRKEMEKTWEAARKLEPYYREMYRRCAAADVGMNRWVNTGYLQERAAHGDVDTALAVLDKAADQEPSPEDRNK
jgi:5-methylthioadenosine/S-adenosylhomocysteine deaminase